MKRTKIIIYTACIAACATAHIAAQVQQFNVPLPQAVAFYDFTGTGEKGFVSCFGNENTSNTSTLYFHDGYSAGFAPGGTMVSFSDTYGPQYAYVTGIDDVNGDGLPDVGVFASAYGGNMQWGLISNGTGRYDVKTMVLFNNFDFDRNGRTDLAEEKPGQYVVLHRYMPDGSMQSAQMMPVAYEEYQGGFDAASWMEMQQASAVNKPLGPNPWAILTGAALDPTSDPVPSSLPDMAIDLNGDGQADLVEAATGTIYYGTPEGKYVVSTVGGAVKVRDLNGDGIADYVVYGGEQGVVKTLVYRGGGEFETSDLMDNLAADSPVWCYDFDRDGDVDILVTFSAYNTDGTTSYTLFYENDGKGNFTAHEDYVEKNYIYSTCRDIDNDGYYDLLLLEYVSSRQDGWRTLYTYNVSVRHGGAGFTLGDAEVLYTIETANNILGFPDDIENYTVEAEDLDGDGCIEIWVSHKHISNFFDGGQSVYKVSSSTNAAPTAPARPAVNYNAADGSLKVSWNEASDKLSSSKDLTYAVRIGSTPGGCDMVDGHALPDGTRRNFMDGNAGSSLEKSLDLRSWPAGTYYVSVQAIDPNHAGSAWSEEVSFNHSYIPVDFTPAATQTCTTGTLDIHYTVSNGMTHSWQLDGGSTVSDNGNGLLTVKWDKAGEKTIVHTVTAADGTQATARQTVNVMDNHFARITEHGIFYNEYDHQFFDYDNDGLVDYALPGQLEDSGLYHNDGDGTFSKAKGIYNQGLDFDNSVWIDWNMDGLADLLYGSYAGDEYGVLLNSGNGNFSKKSGLGTLCDGNKSISQAISYKADMNNDGLVDFVTNGVHGGIYANNGDGTFTHIEDKSQYIPFQNVFDWDGDGLFDVYYLISDGYDYSMLQVFRNMGNFEFELIEVPFEAPVAKTDIGNPAIIDFDNDGYYDILYCAENGAMKVLKNDANQRFVAGYTIETGLPFTQSGGYEGDYFNYSLYDLDNNGYEDILITTYDASRQDKRAIYAVYVDSPTSYRQGFISETWEVASSGGKYAIVLRNIESGKPPIAYVDVSYSTNEDIADNQTTITNTRPAAPATVAARQTETGLHIEWSAATDAETPTKKLRYNLSVKRKGATGDDSYIISPLNGGNNATGPYSGGQYMPNDYDNWNCTYHFPRATQFDIPIDRLPAGEYEVQVQTIDLWGETSDFSAPVTVKVETAPRISAPAMVTVGQTAIIDYVGTRDEGAEPVWDFDGGTVSSGSSWGPYHVSWKDFGDKTISVTVAGVKSEIGIGVNRWWDVNIDLPDEVYFNSPFEITMREIPKSATLRWELEGETNPGEDLEISTVAGEPTGTARIIGHPELTKRRLTLYATIDGNTQERYVDLTVLPEIEAPAIAMVESEGNCNVVTWDAASLPTACNEVIVYKEGSVLNDFIEIGRVAKSAARFTDATSDNRVRSERYAIAATLATGETSTMGDPHRTVLLIINRGIAEGSYNLIWNPYEGRDIASYRIMRGQSPDALQEIAVLAGSATSFVDMAPGSLQYYALELIPAATASAKSARPLAEPQEAATRSNVVYAGNATSIDYVTDLRIVSLQGNTTLNDETPAAYLYAEVMPVSAAYQRVTWSMADGEQLATVNSYGVVTALPNNTGGYVTIKAEATDGSGTSATIQLYIEPIDKPSGIDDATTADMSLRVWPQPVDDVLHMSASSDIVQLWLYDSRGALVRGISQHGITQIGIGSLPTGLYILRIKTADGNEAVEKVIKK